MSNIYNNDLKVQAPQATKIKCKDCMYRDKTEIRLKDKVIKVGITKDFCEKYKLPPEGNGKPLEILFNNEDCEFYDKE